MKTIFVSGASSDIGLAVCEKYLARGDCKIIAHHRNTRPELDALLRHDAVSPFCFDFADTKALERKLANDADSFAQADVFINLAADLSPVTFEDAGADTIMDAFRVNLLPGILMTQLMGPAMAKRGWGRIVHASSIGVKFGGGVQSYVYALSKHAMEFIPSASREWARDGVLVNVVRVGVTDTRIHSAVAGKTLAERAKGIPMGRAAHPDEMAETLCWLGSPENGYVTGQVISASGGE